MGAVAVIDVDPDLAEGLPPAERETASRRLIAPTTDLSVGTWIPEEGEVGPPRAVGMLVLGGLLTRSVTLEGRTTGELLGAGDVLRPWDVEDMPPHVRFAVQWSVHAPARLALLDRRFVAAASHWPSILEELTRRAVRRTRALSLQLALGQVPRIEGRLLLLFWRLAERWGRVTPEGIHVPLRLTHETLAALVAARRPSVTSALGRLAEAGLIRRRDGGWLVDRELDRHVSEFLVAREASPARAQVTPSPAREASGSPSR